MSGRWMSDDMAPLLRLADWTADRSVEEIVAEGDVVHGIWPDPHYEGEYCQLLIKGGAYIETMDLWAELRMKERAIMCASLQDAIDLRNRLGDGLAESSVPATA